jgi:acyl-CoA synthetase (NDP forming)
VDASTPNGDRLLAQAIGAGRSELSEIESKQILEAIGIPVATARLARSAEEAAELATRLGFSAALKVVSPQVTHKSEVGGVELGLGSPAEVRAAFERIRQSLAVRRPSARFDGVAVQAMAMPGIELIVGMTRDDRFGALVVVGLGGTLVEILKDTVLRIAPINAAGARAMLGELRGIALLKGARGNAPADLDAIAELIAKLSGFAAAHVELREIDLNPVAAYSNGLLVLDARILLGPASAQSAPLGDPRHRQRIENLRRGFEARTVAVIGDKRMGGYLWLRVMSRFAGKLYSVQIDPSEIPGIEAMGITNFKSLADVPEPIDYAISAVPRQIAPRILKDCVAAGVRGIGFFTSGFSETGEELGVKLERELRAAAAESDIALVGPNCMGLYNPSIGLCNFPDLAAGSGGDVCFISQSGTHSINFCLQAPIRGIRINKAASIGNVLMLEAADYLEVTADDPATRAIGMYIEGVRDGRRFFASLKHAAARHPVVVWKGGMTDAGARATFSQLDRSRPRPRCGVP